MGQGLLRAGIVAGFLIRSSAALLGPRRPLVRSMASLAASREAEPWAPKKVVICGAGLHGSALAYYLTKAGHQDVTVVEREAVACAASGKGGGFLARDWG